MVQEINNRTLAILLVGAIVISLGGTMVSLYRIGQLGYTPVTGFATSFDNGTVLLQISSVLEVNFTNPEANATIDFGTGTITGGDAICTMTTTGYKNASCTGFNTIENGFLIKNIGNNNGSLYINATKPMEFYGLADGDPYAAHAKVQINVTRNGTISCPSPHLNSSYSSGWADIPSPGNSATNGTAGDGWAGRICRNLGYTPNEDQLRIDLRVVVPITVAGQRRSEIYAMLDDTGITA